MIFDAKHEMIRKLVRQFAETELTTEVLDRVEETGEFPEEIVEKMAKCGFLGLKIPREYGGAGADTLAYVIMIEEIARVSAVASLYANTPNSLGGGPLMQAGTKEQLEKYLVPAVQNKIKIVFALTEPGAGSDVGALATTYKRENGKIYLNGTKTFITSSAGVKYLVIMAKNADDESMFTEFFLDMSKPGVKLSPLTKLGLRMDSCCEVYLDNVELEEKDIFGKEGNGFMRGVSDFNFERWLVGACDYGTAISAFEDAMAHANSRIAFGKPLSRFQLNQLKIAEMCIKLTNMKNMLYEAAWNADNNDGNFDPAAAAMCKYYCANAAFEVTDDAMQIMGGIAVASEHRINRIWRDLRVDRVSGGTDEMMILATSKGASIKYRQ